MAEDKSMRLSQVARVLNVGLTTVVSRLAAKGFKVDNNPNTKINTDQLGVLEREFSTKSLLNDNRNGAETPVAAPPRRRDDDQIVPSLRDKFGRSIAADAPKPSAPAPDVKPAAQPVSSSPAPPVGPKILGRIDLTAKPGTTSFNPETGRSEPVQPVAKAPAPAAPPSAPVVAKTAEPTLAPVVAKPTAPVVAPVAKATEPTPNPTVSAPQPVAVVPAQKPAPVVQPVAPSPAPAIVPKPVDISKPDVQSVVSDQPAGANENTSAPPVRSAAEQPTRPAQQARPSNALESRSERPRDTRPPEPNRSTPVPTSSQPVAESKPAEPAPPIAQTPEPPAIPAPETETIRATGSHQLQGLNVIGKVDLSQFNRPSSNNSRGPGDKRQRIRGGRNGAVGGTNQPNQPGGANFRNDRGPGGLSDRPAGDRGPRPDRPIGDRPPGDRSPTDRPAGDRNQQGNRPPGIGDRGPRPDRPPGDRPAGDRNQQGSGVNFRSDRPPGDRPPGDRNQQGNRPPGTGDRGPRTDRPAGDRSTTDRPASDRPAGDRSSSDRPAGGNTGSPSTPGTGYQGGNNRGGGGGYQGGNNNRAGSGGGNNRGGSGNANRGGTGNNARREAPTASDVKKSIQATNDRMRGNQPNRGADRRKDRRNQRVEDRRLMTEQEELEAKTLKVTEFISANDLATFMEVSVNEVIATCMSLGMFVSINQRLDAEAITVIADEFGFDVQFVSAEDETEAAIEDTTDTPESLQDRAPIVTIMGHVDHGKTSLLDYIRRAKVAAGEAGGITQHIGAYGVTTADGRKVTFLDTPGHEAFTAMRARGAKVTDVVIIVIAADDSVMPQTREAINHAQVAGVPIVFAFSKVDKNGANTEKIREELANMNLLVEDWGGKYQAQEISSKSGLGIDDLLEKVLLEAELLELKANPNRRATGTVIEAELDKGRGYVTTVLVENGTLKQGDIMLVGAHYGRIRAMTDDRGGRIKEAGPATPVQILGLPGAPQAGDKFNVMETDREAREIANKREQLLREQTLRTRRHITLEEIGRRKAIGTFKELNVIVKGDVDGSVEALSDSLLKLSTPEVQVNIIHKGVGQISEADVMLASASDAIVVGFQVRPSPNARRQADQEQIEIRMYSIIYDAINEIRDAMEGLLAPSFEETVTGNIEVRDVFKITKVGTVAGCYVTDGFVKRNNKIRIIRDFIVVHTGEIDALKRFKDDVAEVKFGYECGLSIKNFNDIQVGDVIESFEIKEVKRTL